MNTEPGDFNRRVDGVGQTHYWNMKSMWRIGLHNVNGKC